MWGTQDGLGRFDQQTAQVFAAMAGDTARPFAFAAVIKGRIETDVFDQFAGLGKALDIADECAQSEGHHFPDAAEPDDGQQLRVWGLGFGVWGLASGVWRLGSGEFVPES